MLRRRRVLRRRQEVLERHVQECSVRLGEQVVSVSQLGRDLDPAAAGADAGGNLQRPVDRRGLAVADRDPGRDGRKAVPRGEESTHASWLSASDAAVSDPGPALMVDAESDLGGIRLGALLGGERHAQPELVLAAAEAGRVVVGEGDPAYAANGSRTSDTSRPRLDAIRDPVPDIVLQPPDVRVAHDVPDPGTLLRPPERMLDEDREQPVCRLHKPPLVCLDAPSSRTRS